MNVNPIQLLNMIRSGQNPQQIVMNILQGNNPIIQNAMNLAQNGNAAALQMIARNLAQQKKFLQNQVIFKERNCGRWSMNLLIQIHGLINQQPHW